MRFPTKSTGLAFGIGLTAGLFAGAAAASLNQTPTPAHKQVAGKTPPDSSVFAKDSGKGNPTDNAAPESEHAVDKRYARKVRDAQGTLSFPGDEAADTDTRPCDPKHTLENYFELPSQTDPQAAKDGGVYYLAESLDPAAGRQLFHQSGPDAKPQALTHLDGGVLYFRVSPDGRKILIGSGDGTLYLYQVKESHLVAMAPDEQVPGVAWSPDSTWFAYTSDARNHLDLDLYRHPAAIGQGRRIAELTGLHLVTDVSPDGQAIALTEIRGATDSDVLVWSAQGINNVTRASTPALSYGGRFTRDGHAIFALSDAERGLARLYRFPLSGGAAKPLTSEPTEIDGFAVDDARSALIYRVNEDGYSRLAGWGIDQQGNKTTLLDFPKFPKVVVSLPSFNRGPGGGSFFYARTSLARPSVVWKWLRPIHQPMLPIAQSPIPRRCFSQEELVHYPSFDGRQIPAFLLPPMNPNANPLYLVLAHDGPDAQFRPAFDPLVQYLTARGFGVLAPNVRGSTGYGRDYTDRDNHRHRPDAVQDLIAGAKFLVDNRYARSGRVAVYGEAYGGFLALRAVEAAPDLFAGVAAAIPFLDLSTMLQGVAAPWRAYQQEELGGIADRDFLKSISPLANAKGLRRKALIFTLADDPRVPIGEAEAFRKMVGPGGGVELKALGRIAPSARRWLDLNSMRALGFFLDNLLSP